jgi:hypothetical protein
MRVVEHNNAHGTAPTLNVSTSTTPKSGFPGRSLRFITNQCNTTSEIYQCEEANRILG